MKILFYLAVWKRPEITEICFMGLNRLRKSGLYPMDFLAVISEESMIPLCEKYGVKWVMSGNLPIGRKKNNGLKHALTLDWDYVIELGSDDLIKDDLLKLYAPYFGESQFLSVNSIAFINSETGACRWMKSRSPYGLGRALRRDVIERFPKLYPELNSGLDKKIMFKLGIEGVTQRYLNTETPLTIDIKSEVNIWGYSSCVGDKIPFSEVVEGLSKEEVSAIKALACVTV